MQSLILPPINLTFVPISDDTKRSFKHFELKEIFTCSKNALVNGYPYLIAGSKVQSHYRWAVHQTLGPGLSILADDRWSVAHRVLIVYRALVLSFHPC